MASILPFDELNNLTYTLKARFPSGKLVNADGNFVKSDLYDVIDMMLDLFLLAYAQGNSVTNANLSSNWTPTVDDAMKIVDRKVAGKTWRERVEEHFVNGGSVDDLVRIAETEAHRDANTAALDTARKAGAKTKTWVTMGDEKVRDPHQYLDGVTIGIDDEFITYDGGHAKAPGLFGIPELDINCRCILTFK